MVSKEQTGCGSHRGHGEIAMMSHSTRRKGRRLAASVVEFAFVAPVFFLVLLGVLEYARFVFTLQLLNNSAREGARYALVNTTTVSTANVQSYVDTYMSGQGATQLVGYNTSTSISVYRADPTTGQNTGLAWQNATWGDAIGVSISGTYQPMLPGLLHLSSSLTVKGTCVMTCEAN
jgi:Flp pilus assembly protein TadG